MAKKEEILEPKIERKESSIDISTLQEIGEQIKESTIVAESEQSTDSYFKAIINQLFDDSNIELKTEYLSTQENFVGAKLTFLAKKGNMPLLGQFVTTFERKRVSLERKSRIEIIRALEYRKEEQQRASEDRLKNMLGFN